MPRVLMFAPAFAPACFSEGLVNSKLALAMLRRGWEVVVITMSADNATSYESGWVEPWLPLRTIRHEVESATKGGLPGRCLGLAKDVLIAGHPIQGVHWAILACDRAMELHAEKPFDAVLSRSTSCCAHLPALMFKSHTGIPWIANWNDPPPYLFPPPYHYAISRTKRLFMRRYYRAVAASADWNTFPSKRLSLYLKNELGLKDDRRCRVVPHIALDGFSFKPSELRADLNFCHAGNLSAERHPDNFLKAFAVVANRHRNSVRMTCDILGLENAGLIAAIERNGLAGSVRFLGSKPYVEALAAIAKCDVALLIEAPCENGIFLPSKVIDYAQAGRPILAISPSQGVMCDLIELYGGGLHADNLSVDSIEAALERLVELKLNHGLTQLSPMRWQEEAEPELILNRIWEMIAAAGETLKNT